MPIISDDFKNLATRISSIPVDEYPKSWLKWAESFNVTDTASKNFFSDVDSGKRNIKDIDNYINHASSSTSKFSATLKSTAANMAIMLAVNLAIQGVAKIWDNYVNRVENARKRTDELFDEFKQMDDTQTKNH